MLRNAVIHIANDQPIMADLLVQPLPSDVCLICRNMRTTNGTKPIWVDHSDSTFVLPLSQIRFIEIPAESYQEAGLLGDAILRPAAPPSSIAAALAPLSGEDGAGAGAPEAEPPILAVEAVRGDEGLDGDLLRRIREA